MNRESKSWVAVLMLGVLAFAHSSVSMAACSMERGTISQVIAVEAADPCECGTAMTEFGPLYTNRCLAHCTSDLQLAGVAVAIVSGVSQAPTLLLPRMVQRAAWPRWAVAPPAATVPKRIQLHSFLV